MVSVGLSPNFSYSVIPVLFRDGGTAPQRYSGVAIPQRLVPDVTLFIDHPSREEEESCCEEWEGGPRHMLLQ